MSKTFLAFALLAISLPAGAAQILYQGSPAESTVATISRSEPNMLKVDGRKIRRIHGAEGNFVITPEPETGVAWLKPTTDKPLMSVYITDDANQHYKLLLKIEDIPAETIIVRRKGGEPRRPGNVRNEPRNDEIMRTIIALYDGEGDAKSEIIPLWKGVRFELVRRMDLTGLRGETYRLTNQSDKQIVMDEREFYRPDVQAVSITKPVLRAGESTAIYIISEGEQ
ncbi:MAG: type-F conjugative transfer system secretin TraK [Gallionella sp.]|nr:type-F conjugative transfer system secretin TraK [Gallionella sp.]